MPNRRFAVKFLIFILPILSVILFLELRLAQVPTSYSRKKELAKRLVSTETLVFGTSHAYYDFNPAAFSRPGLNFANTSQSLVIDSQLVEKYLSSFPNLKVIVLNLSYFSFEYRLAGQVDEYRQYFYPRIYGIEGDGGLWSLFDLRTLSWFATFGPDQTRKILLSGFVEDLSEGVNEFGWFDSSNSHLERLPIDDKSGRSRSEFHTSIMREKYTRSNLQAIESIVRLAQERNIKVILAQAPANRTYFAQLDPSAEKRFRENVSQLVKVHGLLFFDYLRDERFTKTDFWDNDHLNSAGALRFSRVFDSEVLRPLLAQAP